MKNRFKYLMLAVAICMVVSAFAYSAWVLLSTEQIINVQEGIEMSYWDGAAWQPIELNTNGTISLPNTTLKPGESQTTFIKVRNLATSGTLNLNYNIAFADYVVTDVQCNGASSTGVEYTYIGNVLDLKVPSGGTDQIIGIRNTLDGAAPLTDIGIDAEASRSNGLSTYVEVCP